MKRKIVRVWVNRGTCLQHEICQVSMAFEMRDCLVAVAHDASKYFQSERDSILDAVMGCPTSSLFIEFDDGKIVSSADYDQSRGLEQMLEF